MLDHGHKYPFEKLTLPKSSATPTTNNNSNPANVVTPPSSPPSIPAADISSGRPTKDARPSLIFNEIRSQLALFQSTQLPGLVNPEIVPVLYEKQVEKWKQLTMDHLEAVSLTVAEASKRMLIAVCPQGTNELYLQLFEALRARFDDALAQAREAATSYCVKQHQYPLQTTDTTFYKELQRRRTIRWQRSLEEVYKKHGEALPLWDAMRLYEHLNPSAEQNIINEIHDVLAVYYEVCCKMTSVYVCGKGI
jgi:hypothetical protein